MLEWSFLLRNHPEDASQEALAGWLSDSMMVMSKNFGPPHLLNVSLFSSSLSSSPWNQVINILSKTSSPAMVLDGGQSVAVGYFVMEDMLPPTPINFLNHNNTIHIHFCVIEERKSW
jgi:hypothetical protein